MTIVTDTDGIRAQIARKTADVERLFGTTEVCRPNAYVEVPTPSEAPEAPTKVFFSVIDSAGTIPAGAGRNWLDKYPTSPEAAYESWTRNLDAWLAETPVRAKLFWRAKPSLESDEDFETKKTYWNVYSRLAAI